MKLFERLKAVWSAKLDPSAKLVLMVLADAASEDDAHPVWLSVETLAERTSLGRSTVIATMGRLEAAGVVMLEREAGRSTRRRVMWSALEGVDLSRPPASRPKRTRPAAGLVQPLDQSSGWTPPVQRLDPHPSSGWTPPVQRLDYTRPAAGHDPSIEPSTDPPTDDPLTDPARERACESPSLPAVEVVTPDAPSPAATPPPPDQPPETGMVLFAEVVPADTPRQPSDVERVWEVYRSERQRAGGRPPARPPKAWHVELRVREHGAEAIAAAIVWAHRSSHQRARWLREGEYLTGQTFWRPGLLPTYISLAAEEGVQRLDGGAVVMRRERSMGSGYIGILDEMDRLDGVETRAAVALGEVIDGF